MEQRLNRWAFILSLFCILLFCMVSFVTPLNSFIFGMHPLTAILFATILTFFLGMLGCSGIRDGKDAFRSFITMVLTITLSFFLIFIMIFGSMLS